MTNLTKYKRENLHTLQGDFSNPKIDKRKRRIKKYTEKITFNLTKEESDLLEKMYQETGVPKTTIIRKKLTESGLFNY